MEGTAIGYIGGIAMGRLLWLQTINRLIFGHHLDFQLAHDEQQYEQ